MKIVPQWPVKPKYDDFDAHPGVDFASLVRSHRLGANRCAHAIYSFRNDNVTIEVIAEGSGPLIVLLPSLGRDSEEFDPIAEQIAKAGFRVVRPQPRGYGASTGPLQNITLHDLAKDLAQVIENEHAGPAILAGDARVWTFCPPRYGCRRLP